MTLRQKLIYGVGIFLSLTGCVKTFGSNYYAQKAYQALGLQPAQPKNSNVMPYIPGDKKAMEKINPYAAEMKQQAQQQAEQQTTQQPQPFPTAQSSTSPTPQAQYQPYPLGNTSNYAQPNPVRAVNSMHVANSYYSTYLAELSKYYNQYADIFSAKSMLSDAQLLKAKSATAKSGNDVMFETENSFDLPLDKKGIITSQRKVIENVKSRTEILKEMPNVVAQLQASFDCMLIEAKNRIYSQKTVCGMGYFQSISVVEARFGSMNEPPKAEVFGSSETPQPVVEQSLTPMSDASAQSDGSVLPSNSETQGNGLLPIVPSNSTVGTGGSVVNNINIVLGEDAKPKPKEQSSHYAKYKEEFEDKAVLKFDNHKSFAVYYDVGSFALDSSAIYSINKAIEFTRDYDDYKITVLGFTDRTSSRDYNKVLSDKRANAVYEALIKRGIAKEKIKKVFFGEDYNSVNTRDGVGEAFNRRVVIEVDATGKFDEEEFITEKGLEGGIVE